MKNSFLAWLSDELILWPSRHPIHAPAKRRVIPYRDGHLEVWIHHRGDNAARERELFLLEFPGTASRAEEPSEILDGAWPDAGVVVWSVNPPGYGSSSGRASLRDLPAMACHAYDELQQVAQGRRVIVAGSSLGCVSALYLAAHRQPNGVLLQNPPDLREVVLQRGARWPLRWVARAVAQHIPAELDSIHNAAQATAPAIFLLAMLDRIVPTTTQQRIYDAYAGPKRAVERTIADHDTPLSAADVQQLQALKIWLSQAQ